jgi:hypothetical protein
MTKPDITNFEDIRNTAVSLLYEQKINIIVLNSTSPMDADYNRGFNIIAGGNSLGRGITLPKLQTVYYCRKSKTPQADTFWQHSCMFGYDRDAGLMRIYIPPTLHRLFTELIRIIQLKISDLGIINVLLSKEVIFFLFRKQNKATYRTLILLYLYNSRTKAIFITEKRKHKCGKRVKFGS